MRVGDSDKDPCTGGWWWCNVGVTELALLLDWQGSLVSYIMKTPASCLLRSEMIRELCILRS